MMRERVKTRRGLYPHWRRKQDSPALLAKERDGWRCVDCGREHRSIDVNAEGLPTMIFMHAAHVHPLDPDYEVVEPIEGQRLRSRCASCHGSYDAYWKERQAELDHQIVMHRTLISRFVMHRFLAVV